MPNAGLDAHALELPPEGGDTMFADMYCAYESTPNAVKRRFAVSAPASAAQSCTTCTPSLPALTEETRSARNPTSGTRGTAHRNQDAPRSISALGVRIEGMSERTAPSFAVPAGVSRCGRESSPPPGRLHDSVLWDNRCAQHCAKPFDDAKYRRHMLRTTIEGDQPVMATSEGSSLATHMNQTRSPAWNLAAPPWCSALTPAPALRFPAPCIRALRRDTARGVRFCSRTILTRLVASQLRGSGRRHSSTSRPEENSSAR